MISHMDGRSILRVDLTECKVSKEPTLDYSDDFVSAGWEESFKLDMGRVICLGRIEGIKLCTNHFGEEPNQLMT